MKIPSPSSPDSDSTEEVLIKSEVHVGKFRRNLHEHEIAKDDRKQAKIEIQAEKEFAQNKSQTPFF